MKILPEFINDLKTPEPQLTLEKVTTHAQFSLSYALLLIASSVVCTLGLLLDVSAVVIGGMIISPLMWPLMKISLGMTYEVKTYVKRALILLALSIIIGFLSALIITLVSPLKLINGEILARTNPTLLDIFVAIAAGFVAALSISKEKISDTLAGVAIATSLMPPLCVAGIGVALLNPQVFLGSAFLFLINVISIIFVSSLTFLLLNLKKTEDSAFRYKGIFIVSGLLLMITVPLFFLLQNYSFQINSYQRVSSVLEREMVNVSPLIYVENVETRLNGFAASEGVMVEADVLIPEGISIDFETQQAIIEKLENVIGRSVNLSLRIQRAISVTSREEEEIDKIKRAITDNFRKEIDETGASLSIDSINVTNKDGVFVVDAVLRGDPALLFTQERREKIEEKVSQVAKAKVELNMDIVPLVRLKSEPELEIDLIKKDAGRLISGLSSQIEVLSVQVETNGESSTATVVATVRTPVGYKISENSIKLFKTFLEEKYLRDISIKLNVILKDVYEY